MRLILLKLQVILADIVTAQDDERRLAQAGLEVFAGECHAMKFSKLNKALLLKGLR